MSESKSTDEVEQPEVEEPEVYKLEEPFPPEVTEEFYKAFGVTNWSEFAKKWCEGEE